MHPPALPPFRQAAGPGPAPATSARWTNSLRISSPAPDLRPRRTARRKVDRVSVVRAAKYRRWAVVGAGIAALCALPGALGALPVHAADVSATTLKARILASADHPYQGYAENDGGLDLPQLPQLGAVGSLLSGSTMIRTWYAGPAQWRTDVVTATGEQDMYQTAEGTTSWDFETGQITEVVGDPQVRLPRPDDFVPPALALRVLDTAAPTDPVALLAPRRIAGIDADGIELTPKTPDTTIGRVDIWADPATGVPLEVSVYARGASSPVIATRFLDVELTAPAASTVAFHPAPGLAISSVATSDVESLLDNRAVFPLPATLGGQAQTATLNSFGAGVAGYGTGFSTFAVLALGDRVGDSAFSAAQSAAAPVKFTDGTGELIQTPLLTVLLARSDRFDRIYLLAGFVGPDPLVKAAGDLLTYVDVLPPCFAHHFSCQFQLQPPPS